MVEPLEMRLVPTGPSTPADDWKAINSTYTDPQNWSLNHPPVNNSTEMDTLRVTNGGLPKPATCEIPAGTSPYGLIVQSGAATVQGNLTVQTGPVQVSGGSLTLTGNSNMTVTKGGVQVFNDGAVMTMLNGSSVSAYVFDVDKSGSLIVRGAVTITATTGVVNKSSISTAPETLIGPPNKDVAGQLTVVGSYKQTAAGTLKLTSNLKDSSLVVNANPNTKENNGKAELAGTLVLAPDDSVNVIKDGQQFTAITTANGRSGQFTGGDDATWGVTSGTGSSKTFKPTYMEKSLQLGVAAQNNSGALPVDGIQGESLNNAIVLDFSSSPDGAYDPSLYSGTVSFPDGNQSNATIEPDGGTGFLVLGSDPDPTLTNDSPTITINDADDPGNPLIVTGNVTILSNPGNLPFSSVSLQSSSNPSTSPQSVTFTATISGDGVSLNDGTVKFYNNGTVLATSNVSNGTATFSTTSLPIGAINYIDAVNSGDNSFSPGVAALVQQVLAPTATTTTLALSASTSVYGNDLTLTATVTPAKAAGEVAFFDGNTLLGTSTIKKGSASFVVDLLDVGTHNLTAIYLPTGKSVSTFQSSESAEANVTITQAASMVTLVSSENPAAAGDTITFTALVEAASGTGFPSGQVDFFINGVDMGSGMIDPNTGLATFSTNSLAPGTYTITAVYDGDSNFTTSTSDPLSQVVNPDPPTVTLTSSDKHAKLGELVTITATIVSENPDLIPTGKVQFFANGALIARVPVVNGQAVLSTSSLPKGDNTIVAVYEGDADLTAAASDPFTETIK